MMHQPEHNIGDHEDPIAGQTWLISFVGMALLTVIFLGLTALYYNYATQEAATMVVSREAGSFEELTKQQQARLQGEARWEARASENPEATTPDMHLVIPIEQAMQRVVQEYGQQ